MKEEAFNTEFVVEDFTKEVTASGNSAHVIIPRAYIGEEARIIIKRKLRICKRCSETVVLKKNKSPDERYCTYCYKGLKKLKELKKKNQLKCRVCGKKISEEAYKQAWDNCICEACWIKEADEESKKQNFSEKDLEGF